MVYKEREYFGNPEELPLKPAAHLEARWRQPWLPMVSSMLGDV